MNYDDIINLSRHVSKKRRPMPIVNRASQFAPFAALTGHGDAVRETARTTQDRVELDEYMKEKLNKKLQTLVDRIVDHPKIQVTYFQPDEKKDGGAYITNIGRIKKVDENERILSMANGLEVPIDQIIRIEGDI